MEELGRVVKLQVQTGPLKQGRNRERYDPGNLVGVPMLEIGERGVVGWCEGQAIQDVHHQDYPFNQGHKGHGLSFNFTGHYERLRQRYGEHLWVGCGGDNVVFAAASPLTLADLQGELVLETQTGERGRIHHLTAATPCLAFTRFTLEQSHPDAAAIKETLQFLSGGQRGFYADWQGPALLIRPGDRLFITGTPAHS